MSDFNGLGLNLGNISRLSKAQSRSISPENVTGEKGKGGMDKEGVASKSSRDLGQGWKISPFVRIESGDTFEVADIDGPGAIQQIWVTPTGDWRLCIMRIYWDDQEQPSVECPVGDFFACGWKTYKHVNSLPICVNPGSGFNSYWEMPFKKKCRITFENLGPERMTLYYQVNYTLTEVPEDAAYFHAQFRRVNSLPYKDVYTIVDGIKGWGQLVGVYMAWQVNNNGWWGEGEIKFFLDGDGEFPTNCGTGTEDYFCGSYNFERREPNIKERHYEEFTTAYAGMSLVKPDGLYSANTRFNLYRWHIMDPVRFQEDLRVTIQALGWGPGGKYLPLRDDIASVAYWYQTLPTAPFPELPCFDDLQIV
jgi:D-arabinan exo alpha-(1,3)/(1,5)-arabinofuranosidase (non-reducing end)